MFSETDFEASRSFLHQYPRHLASDLTGMTAPFTSQWGCLPDLLEWEKGTISRLLMLIWRKFSPTNVFTIVTWSSTDSGDVTTVQMSSGCRKPPAQKLLIDRPIPELWSFESRGSITSRNSTTTEFPPPSFLLVTSSLFICARSFALESSNRESELGNF